MVKLLHICDSLFPTGGFAHSDGLEAAVATGRVSTANGLRGWMDAVLEASLARVDGPAVLRAWQASAEGRWRDVAVLDAELHALRPSSTARSASRAMGSRLLKTWGEIYGDAGSERTRPTHDGTPPTHERTRPARERTGPTTLPVAFGVTCATAGIGASAAVEGFIYTRLAAIISCAMRLMPIGQCEAHALLASALTRVADIRQRIEQSVAAGEPLGAFTPALDLDMMEQQYVRSRLFLS
jgi:urease accessory protein